MQCLPNVWNDNHHKIGLFVASGHSLFLEGMRMLLRNDPSIQLVGEAQHLTDTVEEVRRLRPQVVLWDIPITEQSERDHSVLNAISRMKEADGELKIFVLTITDRLTAFSQYKKAGVSGFIMPETSLRRLLYRIRAADKSGREKEISAQRSPAADLVDVNASDCTLRSSGSGKGEMHENQVADSCEQAAPYDSRAGEDPNA